MAKALNAKQTIGLTAEDRDTIRQQARSRGIGNGLLARVYLRFGLRQTDFIEIGKLIEEEVAEQQERISAAGRANVARRWHTTIEED